MKTNWIITSSISGLIGGIIAYVLTSNWKISCVSAILVLVIVLLNNPARRYMKAFWVVLSMFMILNKFFFEVVGSMSDVHFKFGSNEAGSAVSIALAVLAAICLILDYLERNGKLKGSIFSIKKNQVGDITGDGNSINQTNA